MPIKSNRRRPPKGAKGKPAVIPDYKSLNIRNIVAKMKQESNLYPRFMLFARGIKTSVTPEILNDFLSVLDEETKAIRAAVKASISELEKAA